MTEKLIIENRTGEPLSNILPYIESVINMGKISGSGNGLQYCYHTMFERCDTSFKSSEIHVSAYKNKASDRLVVHKTDAKIKL
jgi:hypothetical protein